MSLIKINKLNVVTVYVSDIDKALTFYTQILGFEQDEEMKPGFLLFNKEADLTLYIEGNREERESSETKYPSLSFCFNCADGVKDALKKIEQANIPIVSKYGDFNGGFAGFQFKDPSGNVLEIAGRP